ncbi:MAG: hypothetical protein WCK34_06065 [Bacteroidota bacterium]
MRLLKGLPLGCLKAISGKVINYALKTFEQIESGFLVIDENDNSAIIRYFYENEESFLSINIENKETGIKYLWMLTEILNAAFERNDQKIIKLISGSTIRKYQYFPAQYNYNIKNDSNYKSLLINVANDHLNHKKYFLAYRIYKELHQIEKSNKKIKELYFHSKRRIIRTLSGIIGVFGFFLILSKYILKFLELGSRIDLLIFGYTGASFLIIFGTVEILLNNRRIK